MNPDPIKASPSRAIPVRLLGVLALLFAEVVVLTLHFDSPRTDFASGWAAGIAANASALGRILIAVAGTLVLLLAPRTDVLFTIFRSRPQRLQIAIAAAVNVGAFALLFALTGRLAIAPSIAVTQISAAALLQWLLLAFTVAAAAAMLLAPAAAWREFAGREWRTIALSLGAGLLVWLAGLAAQQFWRPLAQATLLLAHQLLRVAYPDIRYDPVEGTVGTNAITIEIAPQCSGYEGIALITVFVSLYLWLFRASVVFPRALLLLPLGIVAIWCANVLRIAALVAIGTSVSPEMAVRGFHSQAGWITFTVVALALIYLAHRFGWVANTQAGATASRLAAALLIPFIVLMGMSVVADAFSSGLPLLYPLSVLATAGALLAYRGIYRNYEFSWSWVPVALGLAVCLLWLPLYRPDATASARLTGQLAQLHPAVAFIWVLSRTVGAVLIVPIAEELAFRGYLLRKLVSSRFEEVPARRRSLFSFAASSLVFGILHADWLSGTIAGAVFAAAVYWRGRITDAIVAHVIANTALTALVLGFGRWDLWA